MDDKDHVFARFQDKGPAQADRRETLTIPRRAGAAGSRVVEVVHVKSSTPGQERPRRQDAQLRAATWDRGFPTQQKAPPPVPPMDAPIGPAPPTAHVMPAWEASPPAQAEPSAAIAPRPAPAAAPRQPRGVARRVADPFDAADEGANCLRCGYAIEAAREKRGLMTCAACM